MSPKEILRQNIKKTLENVAPGEFQSGGIGAAVLLRSSPVWLKYRTVFLFLSMHSEIDTQPLVEAALKEGKKIFAPRVDADRLIFCPLLSPDGPWHRGPFGIREPAKLPRIAVNGTGSTTGERRSAEPEDFPALILAPGMAFDREGNRLGHGKAYYDRFFAELDARNLRYTALGLCMDFQIVPEVPVGEHDKKMDGLLTGKELYFVKIK